MELKIPHLRHGDILGRVGKRGNAVVGRFARFDERGEDPLPPVILRGFHHLGQSGRRFLHRPKIRALPEP